MNQKLTNKFFLALVIILLLSNVYFVAKYWDSRFVLEPCVETQRVNGRIVAFAKLFIAKILKAEKELDLETLLELENAARATGDGELRAQWQKFLKTSTVEEAQQEIQNFLEMVVNKIRID